MENTNRLISEMIGYYAGDPKRIQHFIKVHSFAKLIGALENLDAHTLFTLETAAVVHDIGIKLCEQKYGSCNGKQQETEGPAVAKELLERLNYDTSVIERVCYLVGHHHTYSAINGLDYQILVEADFLVNFYEDDMNKSAREAAFHNVFRTKSGSALYQKMFP
ncbi:MAG TPA: HD domain-containing protein [Oscillospiraceae bacterium]|nr:HD domain-containing protein [Oscillospiraceae bacterium]HPF55702.1 HD domain-containing protein [Clostridiales bacterium]HPK35553.1 HD domain-containing protein [Oscillospiraceae bacterium]HPR75915.1 HD domain-containing protein [Oscillospiraceae bacterium]